MFFVGLFFLGPIREEDNKNGLIDIGVGAISHHHLTSAFTFAQSFQQSNCNSIAEPPPFPPAKSFSFTPRWIVLVSSQLLQCHMACLVNNGTTAITSDVSYEHRTLQMSRFGSTPPPATTDANSLTSVSAFSTALPPPPAPLPQPPLVPTPRILFVFRFLAG